MSRARPRLRLAGLRFSHASFTVRSSYLHKRGKLGILPCWGPMWQYSVTKAIKLCWHVEGTPSINMKIMTMVSTWIFVILIGYSHIGSQQGGGPTHVQAWRLDNKGSMGGTRPNRMKIWSSLGHIWMGTCIGNFQSQCMNSYVSFST